MGPRHALPPCMRLVFVVFVVVAVLGVSSVLVVAVATAVALVILVVVPVVLATAFLTAAVFADKSSCVYYGLGVVVVVFPLNKLFHQQVLFAVLTIYHLRQLDNCH